LAHGLGSRERHEERLLKKVIEAPFSLKRKREKEGRN